MTIGLLIRVLDVNQDISLDIARILVLLRNYFSKYENEPIVGTTKVVKLDFLLRYPTILEEALIMKKKTGKYLGIKDYERGLVESKMIRYRFGPWDDRYWSILSTMESMKLLKIVKIDGVTNYMVTNEGMKIAEELETDPLYADYAKRSKTIVANFGYYTATGIMKKVYEIRPELTKMKLGEEISP